MEFQQEFFEQVKKVESDDDMVPFQMKIPRWLKRKLAIIRQDTKIPTGFAARCFLYKYSLTRSDTQGMFSNEPMKEVDIASEETNELMPILERQYHSRNFEKKVLDKTGTTLYNYYRKS